jgi:hypothetical protein
VRRMLHFIAIAILTLVGPVEVVRTMTGPAHMACQCGCGAASEEACQCPGKSTPPQDPAPTSLHESSGSSCSASQSPCSSSTSAASAGMAGKSLDKNGLDVETRPEPKPWSGTRASVSPEILSPGLPGRCKETTEIQQGRPLDRLAKLAVFRI